VFTPEVGLLDVVPWTHGYAHSWAIRWMLGHNDAAAQALMTTFVPSRRGPWTVHPPDVEFGVEGARADLRIVASDGAGEPVTVLLETKVNDQLTDGQIRAYVKHSEHVVLYVPGLTGLLLESRSRPDGVVWVTGRRLVEALRHVQLPQLVQSYVDEVAAQADDMDAARKAARRDGELPEPRPDSGVTPEALEAVAWVAEVASALQARGTAHVYVSNRAHDWGVYWPEGRSDMEITLGASAYVDVIAAHGGWEYAVCIKAGGGQVDDRYRLHDHAMTAGEPGAGWRRGRRGRGESFRIWIRDAGDMSANEAADAAVEAQRYIARLATR
jgi:hypothetical protein